MAYTRTTWADGDVITAAKLNNEEAGIEANDQAITVLQTAVAGKAGTDTVAASAAVSNGSIVFKNGSETTLFSVALPVYNGGVA